MRKLQIMFARVVKYHTVAHFPAFGSVVSPKKGENTWLDFMPLMTSYLVAIATDSHQT